MRDSRRRSVLWFWLVFALLPAGLWAAEAPVRHELEVRLSPSERHLSVVDRIEPGEADDYIFTLHESLTVSSVEGGRLSRIDSGPAAAADAAPTVRYRLATEGPKVVLHYEGTLHHPLEREAEYARSFSTSPGLIGEEGVFLSGASTWAPNFGDRLVAFRLQVDLPEPWDAVSQGRRVEHVLADGRRKTTWDSPEPMDEIYLVAAPFAEYSQQAGAVTAYAFLRTPDPNLAAKYLEATAQYIDLYTRLIGPYPYDKFALVENFWETGYGMPSFTLLGSTVIRLPFIINSSYPHEILHNWWGNSVFVDYAGGNWCEGLTAYLADFLIKEGQGQGAEYRRDALKRYRNFVRSEQDFPLSEFRVRHSPSTEAVGYGKSLMMWHMLRLRLGDDRFIQGLQSGFRRFRFQRVGFSAWETVFSEVSGEDLKPFFDQWVNRAGAPELRLSGLRLEEKEDGFVAQVQIQQRGTPFALRVPLAFTLEGAAQAEIRHLDLDTPSATYTGEFSSRPVRVDVDPEFDLFRRLHRNEIPPSLGQVFGAEKVMVILPSPQDPAAPDQWRRMAESWTQAEPGRYEFVSENDLKVFPSDRTVWILGSTNSWAALIARSLIFYGTQADVATLRFGAQSLERKGKSFVYVIEHPAAPDSAAAWIGTDTPAALPGLARKLPHYGKYSYLAFEGEEPTNLVKGEWPAVGSPLVALFATPDGPVDRATLPDRQPLARPESVFSAERLEAHVQALAAPDMQGRGLGTEGIRRAADYIAEHFKQAGLQPGADSGYFQTWTEAGGPQGRPFELRNVIGVLPGTRSEWADQSIVVAAHYDHLGLGWPDSRTGEEGKIHPGADDNASGVAVLLELASLLAGGLEPQRSVIFVAFSGEEWELKGSRHYVQSMTRWPAAQALAAVNLDSVGHLGEGAILVLGSGSADEWVHVNRGIGFTTGIQSQAVADDFGSSDQKSFLDAGVPAVQIFTGPHAHYHRPSDTPDTLDYDGMVKVATFVREAVVYLSERDRPLTSRLATGAATGAATEPTPSGGRRVSLGTLPDFTFSGPGVRIDSVLADSPAEQAGLMPGDLLTAIDGKPVTDLRGYSDILKSYAPGDTIRIEVSREGKPVTVQATLKAR